MTDISIASRANRDGETAVELAVNPALFREAFAADLPARGRAVAPG
jgi:hypothetical protein